MVLPHPVLFTAISITISLVTHLTSALPCSCCLAPDPYLQHVLPSVPVRVPVLIVWMCCWCQDHLCVCASPQTYGVKLLFLFLRRVTCPYFIVSLLFCVMSTVLLSVLCMCPFLSSVPLSSLVYNLSTVLCPVVLRPLSRVPLWVLHTEDSVTVGEESPLTCLVLQQCDTHSVAGEDRQVQKKKILQTRIFLQNWTVVETIVWKILTNP